MGPYSGTKLSPNPELFLLQDGVQDGVENLRSSALWLPVKTSTRSSIVNSVIVSVPFDNTSVPF